MHILDLVKASLGLGPARADPLPPLQLREAPLVYPSYQLNKPTWPTASQAGLAKYYTQVVIAFACINLIADAAAAATLRVYDEEDPETALDEHPLRLLLARPNAYMSESEFINTMVKAAAVYGYAVAEKERAAGPLSAGMVLGLHPLRSDWLKPIPRKDNVIDWEYTIPSGEKYQLAGQDVVAWTYQGSPTMQATGLSPLVAAHRELAIETAMVDFTKAFFDGGGVPMTGLVLDEDASLSDAQAKELKAKYEQLRSEPWQPVVLQTVKDVRRLGMDLNEMAYKDLRHLTSTQICTAFRVPPVMLGTLAGLENSPWSKYEEARKSFYEDTIVPLWSRLDGAFTRSLLPEIFPNAGISFQFDVSQIPAFQEDDTAQYAKAAMAGVGEFVTVNERRAMIGLGPVRDGDVFLRSMVSIEVPAALEGERAGLPRSGQWQAYLEQASPLQALPHGGPVTAEVRASLGATAKKQMTKAAKQSTPWLRDFFAEQGERVLEQLGLRSRDLRADQLGLLQDRAGSVDWQAEAQAFRTVLTRVHMLSGQLAFDQVNGLLGVDLSFDLANPNVAKTIATLGHAIVDITEQTRLDVTRVLGAGLEEGSSIQELADSISDLFVETYKGRAETIARTETMQAYNYGSALGYEESGEVDQVELLDNPDHPEDYGASDGLTCADRHGLVVALSSVDQHIEAEHPNGSLAMIPLLKEA